MRHAIATHRYTCFLPNVKGARRATPSTALPTASAADLAAILCGPKGRGLSKVAKSASIQGKQLGGQACGCTCRISNLKMR